MSCCGLLNGGLWFARLFRLGGCQLLDLPGYNMGSPSRCTLAKATDQHHERVSSPLARLNEGC